MLHMIGQAIFGLIIGIVARLLLPGSEHVGIIITAILGMVGGWLGAQIGKWLGWYKEGEPAGFLMSVVGAMVLFVAYRYMF
jgi:uncharacterized membrane protein YeaQ/YmgE (transglycosylase-associated protein family)